MEEKQEEKFKKVRDDGTNSKRQYDSIASAEVPILEP